VMLQFYAPGSIPALTAISLDWTRSSWKFRATQPGWVRWTWVLTADGQTANPVHVHVQ
jgi:hypothetical protein